MGKRVELDGLTPEESNAARLRAQGLSQVESYRRAFDVKRMKPKTVYEKSSKLFSAASAITPGPNGQDGDMNPTARKAKKRNRLIRDPPDGSRQVPTMVARLAVSENSGKGLSL